MNYISFIKNQALRIEIGKELFGKTYNANKTNYDVLSDLFYRRSWVYRKDEKDDSDIVVFSGQSKNVFKWGDANFSKNSSIVMQFHIETINKVLYISRINVKIDGLDTKTYIYLEVVDEFTHLSKQTLEETDTQVKSDTTIEEDRVEFDT